MVWNFLDMGSCLLSFFCSDMALLNIIIMGRTKVRYRRLEVYKRLRVV